MRAASNNLELETRCKVCRKAKQEENVKRKWCWKENLHGTSRATKCFFFSAHRCRILFMLIFSSFFRQRLATRKVQNGFLFFRKLHTYLNRLVYLIMEYYMAVSRQLKQQLSRKLAQKRTQLYLRHYQWFIQQMDMESSILMLKIRKW